MHVIVCNTKVPVLLKSDDDMDGAYGLFQSGDEAIWVRKDLEIKQRRRTIAHEAFHAVFHFTGHSYMFDKFYNLDIEEALVRALEFGIGEQMVFPPAVERWISGSKGAS